MNTHTKVRFDLHGDPVAGETLWAEQVEEHLYRLLNSPFYAMGYAEGDVVLCRRHNGFNEVERIVQDSGNGTIRLLFTDSQSPSALQVLNELTSVGCTYERASSNLVSVTVPPTLEVPLSQLSNYLNDLSEDVLPGWEVGKSPRLLIELT